MFLPSFPALLSLSVMESDNQTRAAHLSCQGPRQKGKAWSQGAEDLRVPRISIPSNTTSFSAEPQESKGNVLAHLHRELCRPIFWGARVHSNMCCMGGASLGGKGAVTGDTGKALRAIFFSPPSHPNISVPCKGGVRCWSSPLDGFYIAQIHHCVSNKAVKSTTGSSLHDLKQYKSLLQRTLLTWGWMHSKIFQVILS